MHLIFIFIQLQQQKTELYIRNTMNMKTQLLLITFTIMIHMIYGQNNRFNNGGSGGSFGGDDEDSNGGFFPGNEGNGGSFGGNDRNHGGQGGS